MKKIIMSIIVATLCISLCACEEAKQNSNMVVSMCIALCACGEEAKQNSNSEDKLLAIQMNININEATLYLSDANEAVLASMNAKDHESSVSYFKEALETVTDAKLKVDASISSPNFISEELKELEENYNETIVLLSRLSELSEEEKDEFVTLVEEGTSKHVLLYKALYAFSVLNEIRWFDQLPDDEAQRTLEDFWWLAEFHNYIKCPETIDEIDEQELYLLWAKRYFEEFDEDTFLEELEILRQNDNLASPECNQKWTEFIKNFFITETEAPSSTLGVSVFDCAT